MSTIADLSRFRAGGSVTVTKRPTPDLGGLDWVIAFDPSLKNTGVVILTKNDKPQALTLRTGSDYTETGSPLLMAQALDIADQARDVIEEISLPREGGNGMVLYEIPPVGGGRVRNTESAMLAALALHMVCDTYWDIRGVSPQKAKRFICGNANAKKAEAHAAMAERYDVPDVVTNEHERDAYLVALTYLEGQS